MGLYALIASSNPEPLEQANLALALPKIVVFNWPVEGVACNFVPRSTTTLNQPQFSNLDTNFTSPTCGLDSLALSPRVGQLAAGLGLNIKRSRSS
jgi:hypothetical protein